MTAHVSLNPAGGPLPRVLCPECSITDQHPNLKAAQNAARTHNTDQHAYPEQTLEIGGLA